LLPEARRPDLASFRELILPAVVGHYERAMARFFITYYRLTLSSTITFLLPFPLKARWAINYF
jgi:hypothetical protein